MTPVSLIGLPDQFVECGSVPCLQAKYGLTEDAIITAIEAAVSDNSTAQPVRPRAPA
jgi:hypothetical protein